MTPRTLPKVLTDEELRALLAIPSRRYPTGRRNRALLAMMGATTCLRVSEALALKLRDVNLAEGKVNVWRGKGKRDRTAYLSDAQVEALRGWLEVRPKGAATLFCTLAGRPLSTSYVRQMVARLAERAGIEWRVHPHSLRHTGASQMLRGGFTLAEVQKTLGHSNVSTTSVYLHVFDGDLREKARAFGAEAA